MNPMNPTKPHITEKQFQAAIVQYAKRRGWMTYHTRDSRGSAPGFPDLVMARVTREDAECIVAELKIGENEPTDAQKEWLDVLAFAGIRVFVWKPSDWDEIERTLA